MKGQSEVPASAAGKSNDVWHVSKLNREKGKNKVIINKKKRSESGEAFALKTSNRFDVLFSDDNEQYIKNCSDEMLCSDITTSTNQIMEIGDPLTKNKVIRIYHIIIIDYN